MAYDQSAMGMTFGRQASFGYDAANIGMLPASGGAGGTQSGANQPDTLGPGGGMAPSSANLAAAASAHAGATLMKPTWDNPILWAFVFGMVGLVLLAHAAWANSIVP